MLTERVIGLHGLALLRNSGLAPDRVQARLLAEIGALVSSRPNAPRPEVAVAPAVPMEASAGYDEWAVSYDDDLVGGESESIDRLEELAVRPLLDQLPLGNVLDAGCGTGRHSVHLAARGHSVVGVDVSREMVRRARLAVPEGDFRVAPVEELPFGGESFDSALCALALSHLADPKQAVAELARVTAKNGRVIVSIPHPFSTAVLGLRTVFVRPNGDAGYVPEYTHLHGEMIAAFAAAGLAIRRCIEPMIDTDQALALVPKQYAHAAELALVGMPVFVVWELARLERAG